MSLSNKIIDVLTVAGFLGGLCLPFADELLRPVGERDNQVEFRRLAHTPRIPWKVSPSDSCYDLVASEEGREWITSERGIRWLTYFPKRYEAFHSDNFGLRDFLLRNYCTLIWNVFGESPSGLVVRGQDDWVFTNATNELAVWRGGMPFTTAELKAWRRCLRARKEFFAKEGIEYLLCVAPHKEAVYPELMADWELQGENRVRQLQRFLGDEDVGFVYILDALLESKSQDTKGNYLYRRFGSHWGERGAKAGCDAIVDRLHSLWPNIPKLPYEAYKLVERGVDLADDMGARLRLSDDILGLRPEHDLISVRPRTWRSMKSEFGDRSTKNVADGLPSAWVQHDSFGAELAKFVSECFGEVTFAGGSEMDVEAILAAKPDVVINLVYERVVNSLPPAVPHKLGDPDLAARFADSPQVLTRVSASDGWTGVTPNDRVYAHPEEQGLVLDSRRLGVGLWLPLIPCPPERDLLYRVEMTAENAGTLRLVYSTKNDLQFEPHRSVVCKLLTGHNVIYFELLAPELAGRVLLSMDGRKFTNVLHSIEVRAAKF